MLRRPVLVAIFASLALAAGPVLPQEAQRGGSGTLPAAAGAERRGQTWLDPEGNPLPFAEVDEVLDFLAGAEVLSSWPIETGITQPRKLLLERDGVRAHAILHDVDIQRQRTRLRRRRVYFFRDHYAHNVAAFELGRLLGIANIPPAVVRRIGRKEGSVQLWIEKANTEADRRRQGIVPAGDWRLVLRDMQVFDNLANNTDRNQGNVLYDTHWNPWYIDHTRAFNRDHELPSPERVTRCSRRLWKALRELDETGLRRVLQPYLGRQEIDGILHRHERLLALIEERLAARGEDAVLFSYGSTASPVTASADEAEVPPPP